ncbi:hypothetical protein [Enterococcus thailandicus]|uniref:hypothetical protein n=1 Tax=Enterococcus thailandicus TaxID=417368 RepID=UPI00244D917B|nr:hypothetical protein [Enterococcus thailandicus]GMC00195.1 hypothetical protein K2F_04540 [Enterococcus thailandicus]
MDELTNEAKYLLSMMYKDYLQKRKSGVNRSTSLKFGNLDELHETVMPEWSIEDVKSVCWELMRHNMISAKNASSRIQHISLNTEAIAMLETTFKDKVDIVLDYAVKIKSLIPFI